MSRLDYYGLVLEVKTINNEQLLLKVLTPDAIIDFVEVNLKRFTKEEISKISIYNTIVLYNNLSKINHPAIKLNVLFLSTFDDIKNYSLCLPLFKLSCWTVLQQQLFERNYEPMIFIDSRSYGHLSESTANKIAYYRLSGVLTFVAPTSRAAQILRNNNVPVVLIGRDGKLTNTSSVYTKDTNGGKLAAEELLKLNGQEFLYLTTHGELQINSQRYNGFKTYLLNKNISTKKIHNITGNLEVNAMDELEKLLKTTKIDSIFCFSDLNAYEVIEKLNELNYKVPEDINVIGYDNLQDYIPYPIKVSSIDNNKGEMIEKSLDILFDQINNGIYEEAKNKKISVKYQSGNTTKDY